MRKQIRRIGKKLGYLSLVAALVVSTIPVEMVYAQEVVYEEEKDIIEPEIGVEEQIQTEEIEQSELETAEGIISESVVEATTDENVSEEIKIENASIEQTSEESTIQQTEEIESEEAETEDTLQEILTEEVLIKEILTEEMLTQETLTEETTTQESQTEEIASIPGYVFSGNEAITIQETTGTLNEQGTVFTNEVIITLSGFTYQEEIEEQELSLTYQVTQAGELISQGELSYQGDESKSFAVAFHQAGEYDIHVIATGYEQASDGSYQLVQRELGYAQGMIEKQSQELVLSQTAYDISFGDRITVEDIAVTEQGTIYPGKLCMQELPMMNDCRILAIEGNQIRAVGVNSEQGGYSKVRVWREETAFYDASQVEEFSILVRKVAPQIQLTVHTPQAVMYDKLRATIQVCAQDESYADLLEQEQHLVVDYQLTTSDDKSTVFTDEVLQEHTETGNGIRHTLDKWVTRWNFTTFKKGTPYQLNAKLRYTGAFSPYELATISEPLTLDVCQAQLEVSLEQDGVYDYRTYYGESVLLDINLLRKTLFAETELDEAEKREIIYTITSSDDKVIRLQDRDTVYTAMTDQIPLEITGVGSATLTIQAQGSDIYAIEDKTLEVVVKNSALREEDIVIYYQPLDGTSATYHALDFTELLEQQNHWINGEVCLEISEQGQRYYDTLGIEGEVILSQDLFIQKVIITGERPLTQYQYWMEHQENNATTKAEENGVETFVVGIDQTLPQLQNMEFSTDYYAETSTENTLYYAQDFWLKASFQDNASGIHTIQYSVNVDKGADAQWYDVDKTWKKGDTCVDFEIQLSEGIYTGIGIRAIDVAGNMSDITILQNTQEQGERYIQIVVNRHKPQITLETWKQTGEGYQSEWTNEPVRLCIVEEPKAEFFAGIAQYQYQYVKVGENFDEANTDAWKEITQEWMLGNELTPTNINGTYYVRAISNCGVVSDVQQLRVKLQQTLPEKKELRITRANNPAITGWYNKQTGTPYIAFEYPEYDNGVVSGEYGAPISIHYQLTIQTEQGQECISRKATIGVLNDKAYADLYSNPQGQVHCTDLESIALDFGYEAVTGYAKDGIYTLEYWICDEAGNESEHDMFQYQIDTHEPDNVRLYLAEGQLETPCEDIVYFERFYNQTVEGYAQAEYGISGATPIQFCLARHIGDWENTSQWLSNAENTFMIQPSSRCIVYALVKDRAGNETRVWSDGIVVDNQMPFIEGQDSIRLNADGANEEGFYKDDISVDIAVTDEPIDGESAGLASVTCTIGKDETQVTSTEELFSFMKERPTLAEIEAASSFHTTHLISSQENESNTAFMEVTATDRSGNQSMANKQFKIDVTKPVLELTFDDASPRNGNYYQQQRVATLQIVEHNFDVNQVLLEVTKDGEVYPMQIENWTHEGDVHVAIIHFIEDGDYTVSVSCTDLADNVSEKLIVEPFTIDCTVPVCEITYDWNQSYQDGYFHRARTATIQITEHNFSEQDFVLQHIQTARGMQGMFSTWKHDGDVHTITYTCELDGHYVWNCHYTDLAGNEMEMIQEEFYIDQINPVIEIYGIEPESANAGEISPVVIVRDAYIDEDGIAIRVITGRGEHIEIQGEFLQQEYGYMVALPELTKQADDIYFLQLSCVDYAGNQSEQEIRFSLNRHGSTYDVTDMQSAVDAYYNRYESMQDMQVLEMNVDTIEDFSVYVSRNGKMLLAKEVKNRPLVKTEDICYSVQMRGDERKGYTYSYTLYRENFAQEGVYHFVFYSKDRAGNEMNSEVKTIQLQFVIDNTAPMVVINGVESGQLYKAESHTAHVMVTDNFMLAEAGFDLVNEKGKCIENWDYMVLAKEDAQVLELVLPSYEGRQSLQYRVVDKAGNKSVCTEVSQGAICDFIITTNVWLQLIHSPMLMTTLAGTATTGTSTVVYVKRRKKKTKTISKQ